MGGPDKLMPLASLCRVYADWGKPEKPEPCDRQLVAILEKEFGPDSPQLLSTLKEEAQALRSLHKVEEAAKVEQRIKSIQRVGTSA